MNHSVPPYEFPSAPVSIVRGNSEYYGAAGWIDSASTVLSECVDEQNPFEHNDESGSSVSAAAAVAASSRPPKQEYRYPNGSLYSGKGYFSTDAEGLPTFVPHGKGVMKYAAPPGLIYDGEWQNGMYHGWGEVLYPSGARNARRWRENEPEEIEPMSRGDVELTHSSPSRPECTGVKKPGLKAPSNDPIPSSHVSPPLGKAPPPSNNPIPSSHVSPPLGKAPEGVTEKTEQQKRAEEPSFSERKEAPASPQDEMPMELQCQQLHRVLDAIFQQFPKETLRPCKELLSREEDRAAMENWMNLVEERKKREKEQREATMLLMDLCRTVVAGKSSSTSGAPEEAYELSVRRLIERGADVHARAKLGNGIRSATVLHHFIRSEKLECVRECLGSQKPLDFTVEDTLGRTVLHTMCYVSTAEKTKALLSFLLNRFQSSGNENPQWAPPATGLLFATTTSEKLGSLSSDSSSVFLTNDSGDKVNWTQKDKGDRDFLSSAAANGRLGVCWSVIQRYQIPLYYFTGNATAGVKNTVIKLSCQICAEDKKILGKDIALFIQSFKGK